MGIGKRTIGFRVNMTKFMLHVSDERYKSQAATSPSTSQIKGLMVCHRTLNPLNSLHRCLFLHFVSQSPLDSRTDADDAIFMMMQSKVQNLLVLLGSIPHTNGGRQMRPCLSHLRSRTHPTQHFQCHANTQHMTGRLSTTFSCSSLVCSTFGN